MPTIVNLCLSKEIILLAVYKTGYFSTVGSPEEAGRYLGKKIVHEIVQSSKRGCENSPRPNRSQRSKKAAIVRPPLRKFGHVCYPAQKSGKSDWCLVETRYVSYSKFRDEHIMI